MLRRGYFIASMGAKMAKGLSFKRHRFPPAVIRHAVWLYLRFTLSLRDVEEMLAHRGVEVSYETIKCWTLKFGQQIAASLNARRRAPSPRWHLDEMVCSIKGKRWFLWRAVDDEGVVLDMIMQRGRDTAAALRLLTKLLRISPWPQRASSLMGFARMDQRSTNSA